VFPQNSFVWDASRSSCGDGETLTVSGNEVRCVDELGAIQSNITGTTAITGIGIGLAGLVIGFVLMVRFSPPRDPQELSDKFDAFAEKRGLQRVHQHITPMEKKALKDLAENRNAGDLASRLKQIEDAYKQGLINKTEYEKARQSVLDGIDD